MAVHSLPGKRRTSLGKGGARKARAAGQIPGVLYGHGEDPMAVSVTVRDFDLMLRRHGGGNAVVTLGTDAGDFTALVRDVQYDPITHGILHIDFQHISLTEQVEVEVAVHLVGIPVGVKDGGGILEPIMRHLSIRCLPTEIPSSIDVDVTHLEIGDSIHVSDVKIANFELLSEPEDTLATVVPPTVVEEAAPAADAEAAAAEGEPEVIAKGKKDDEDEGEGKDKDKDKGKGKKDD